MSSVSEQNIFAIDLPGHGPVKPVLDSLANRLAGRVLRFNKLEQIYNQAAVASEPREFIERVLGAMGIVPRMDPQDLAKIPPKGPLVVVANHPYGGMEGLVLAYHLLGVRSDVKMIANYLLGRIPQLRDLFVFVDPFDRTRSVENNVGPLRESMRWVTEGGALAAFPAGEVAHLQARQRRVIEPHWNRALAHIADKAKAPVVLVNFQGRNSNLFQVMGLIHPSLRTVLLPREMAKKSGCQMNSKVGGPIAHNTYGTQGNHQEMIDYLRWRTGLLDSKPKGNKRLASPIRRLSRLKSQSQAVALPQNPDLVRSDVEALPPEQVLLVSGKFKVFYAHRSQIPFLIREIGRLREICFRKVGEGTGRESDLDKFDDYYLQLGVWNQAEHELVGGYRLGLADQIIAQRGVAGLYTSTLFKFQPEFFERIPGALEMGRSFVAPKYQRSYSALLLLWKGIGAYIVKNPHYRHLFGPVSVSAQYSPISQRLMMDFLNSRHASHLTDLVEARRYPHLPGARKIGLEDRLPKLTSFEEVSEIVADLEQNAMGAPILLKQYLKLSARSACWNLDPEFGNVLDCLLVADLMHADHKTMDRYCGKDGASTWRSHHRSPEPSGLARCA